MPMPSIGLVTPPELPPESILTVARAAEEAGLDELWLWEDCFSHSGLAPAAAVLASTSRIAVGLGLMPVPLRAPSLTAMEIASVARLFPARFRPGLGHGVQDWMGQAGVRVQSPLTLLREHVDAVTRLLAGERVTTDGRYVRLTDVALQWPPQVVPDMLVGGRGPKTLALAGELAAGVILDDVTPGGVPDVERIAEAVGTVRGARSVEGEPQVIVVLPAAADATPDQLRERLTTLGEHGVTTVTVVAGFVDGPPSGDEREILDLAQRLSEVRA